MTGVAACANSSAVGILLEHLDNMHFKTSILIHFKRQTDYFKNHVNTKIRSKSAQINVGVLRVTDLDEEIESGFTQACKRSTGLQSVITFTCTDFSRYLCLL